MYQITKENAGHYTPWTFVKRGLGLVSPKEYRRFKQAHLGEAVRELKLTSSESYELKVIPQNNAPEIADLSQNSRDMTINQANDFQSISSSVPKKEFSDGLGGVKGSSLFDYYVCLVRYGAIVADYFEYEFWKKSSAVRKEYVTMLDAKRITRHFNKGRIDHFNDKQKFNTFFAEEHKLKDWYFPSDRPAEEFVRWVEGCNRHIIVKPNLGASGVGIYKPDVSTDEKVVALYEKLKDGEDCFCEEVFAQTGSLHRLNPSSLNTVRVYTLNVNGAVRVMNMEVRIGAGGSVVDNIHGGGMVADVDLENGWLTDAGYNLTGQRFLFHPHTKELIPGVKIPRFEEIKTLCKQAAAKIPDVGFIAWDVAVSDEMVCLIEGNNGGNFDAIQCAAQKGCRKQWFDAMKEKV